MSSLPVLERPPPRAGEGTHRLLLATDLSGASEAATAQALELAERLAARDPELAKAYAAVEE